jgi:hypothetical protein
MGYSDVSGFLLHLATKEGVAASTQNQALNALLFLYREVLGKDLDGPIKAIRAKSAECLPTSPRPGDVPCNGYPLLAQFPCPRRPRDGGWERRTDGGWEQSTPRIRVELFLANP